mmetsp:Transcript_23617/g.51543  ORF Transcript_23617/g.51543 Transcript_23617/m.51543 type:complete len:209 (-) Transcript_23617:762-1388(-)
MAARYSTPARMLPGVRPRMVPLACGQFGVRAPARYGRKLTPRAPAGSASASAVMSAWLSPKHSRTSSVAVVQFCVHTSGIQPPVASQNGAIVPEGSITGLAQYPNNVPLVPSETTSLPLFTAPDPRALIMLSPLPGATWMPDGSLSRAAASGSRVPIALSGETKGGSLDNRLSSTDLHRSSSKRRFSMSSRPMPLASPHSITHLPVSL